MKLKRDDLKEKKMVIMGLTGTGKTTLAKFIAKKFKTLVYTPHKYEWLNEDVYLYVPDDFYNDFSYVVDFVKKKAKEGKIDLLVIDEMDLLIRNNYQIENNFLDLLINHRHYGLSILGITRRLQNIPTQFYEECHFLFVFAIQSPNAIKKLNDIDGKIGDMAKNLKGHDFIVKKQGEEPFITRLKL